MRADQHLGEVMKGASSSMMIQILGSILGFAVSVIIARMLGAEGSGVYYLALSVATIAATVGRVGFDNTVVRFIASHASVQEWGAVRQVYRTAMKAVAMASLLISIVLFSGAEWIANALFNKPYMELPLRLVSVSVLPLSFAMIQAESLRGLKNIRASQLIKNVSTSLGILVLFYPIVSWLGAKGAVAAFVVATIATAVTAWFLWQRVWKSRSGFTVNSQNGFSMEALFRSSWSLFWAMLSGLVIMQGSTIIVGIWGSAQDVGIFNTANRVASLLIFPLVAMISILSPKFTAMHRQGDVYALKNLARNSSAILTFYVVPAGVVAALNAERIMTVFGQDFKRGAIVLIVLLVGVVINVATGAINELLVMTGFEIDVKWVNFMGALLLVIFGPLMLFAWGVVGVAVALSMTFVFVNLAMLILVKKRLGFWAIAMPGHKYK